jgi:hypothetical protein
LLRDPAALITPQFAPIFALPSLVALAIGHNQFNPPFLQALPHMTEAHQLTRVIRKCLA